MASESTPRDSWHLKADSLDSFHRPSTPSVCRSWVLGGSITAWQCGGSHSACQQLAAKRTGFQSGPDSQPNALVVAMRAKSAVTQGPKQFCFCAGSDLGAARSGLDRLEHRRWEELADVQDPCAKGFYVEEVQSQTDRAQMLRDLGAALNHPLSRAPENGPYTYLSGFSLDYVR